MKLNLIIAEDGKELPKTESNLLRALTPTIRERYLEIPAIVGCTEMELVSKLGISLNQHSAARFYFQNKQRYAPSAKRLIGLAVNFNLDVNWMLGLTDTPIIDRSHIKLMNPVKVINNV